LRWISYEDPDYVMMMSICSQSICGSGNTLTFVSIPRKL